MDNLRLETLGGEEFRRLTGVTAETFTRMMEILEPAEAKKHEQGGRACKLSLGERLMMTLEYLREYRTYFHVGQARQIKESTAFKNIRWIEDTLVRDGTFSLPGKKALLKSERVYEVIVVDGTESPIERPKKSSENTIRARKSVTRSKHN
jgi:hypothetical protein